MTLIEKNFFIIHSDNLQEIKTKLYGYCILDDRIIDGADGDELYIEPHKLTGRGAYVFVQNDSGGIHIYQDFIGCYGLYLFNNENFFALSNSFLYLVDYLKSRYPITFNEDYANHLMLEDLTSYAYSETIIHEIRLLPRNAIVEISILDRKLSITRYDYKENTVELDSEEAFAIMDRWFQRWTGIYRSIKEKTNFIQIDLTGGMDSRVVFMLALKSGINLNEVSFACNDEKAVDGTSDINIAKQIAEYYSVPLNQALPESEYEFYPLDDIVNLSLYLKLSFHNGMYYSCKRTREKIFHFNGYCGEYVRPFFNMTSDEFVRCFEHFAKNNPYIDQKKIEDSTRNVLIRTINELKDDYGVDTGNKYDFSQRMYRDTRGRYHFGRSSLEYYFSNHLCFSPLGDPELNKIRPIYSDCRDGDLLLAAIYTRYEKQMLNFPFTDNRIIDGQTIACAEQLNERYPFFKCEVEKIQMPVHIRSRYFCPANPPITIRDVEQYILKIYNSTKFYNIFTTFYSNQIYRDALIFYNKLHDNNIAKPQPLRRCYVILAIVKMLSDVGSNQNLFSANAKQALDHLAAGRPKVDLWDVLDELYDDLLARFEFHILDCDRSELSVLSLSDPAAYVRKPAWFQKNGTGIVLESRMLSLDIILRCETLGTLEVKFSGRKDNKNKIAHWIDFKTFEVNNEAILHEITPAWYDHPVIYRRIVQSGEELKIHVEWDLHHAYTINDMCAY